MLCLRYPVVILLHKINEYSFTYMAKQVDSSKMDRIREKTMDTVVERGYGGASISLIAKGAEVSEGYLYRFYKGKSELVNDLLNTNVLEISNHIEDLTTDFATIKDIMAYLVRYFFEKAKENPRQIKFLFVLMNDYAFSVGQPQLNSIKRLCEKIIAIGQTTGEISDHIKPLDVYLMGVVMPIQYLNLQFKQIFDDCIWTDADRDRLIATILMILQK